MCYLVNVGFRGFESPPCARYLKKEGEVGLYEKRPIMRPKSRAGSKRATRHLRNLLPYFMDWNDWNTELLRLEGNVVTLRRHRFRKLARTLEDALPVLRAILDEERKEHAFSVNSLLAKLNREDRVSKGSRG